MLADQADVVASQTARPAQLGYGLANLAAACPQCNFAKRPTGLPGDHGGGPDSLVTSEE